MFHDLTIVGWILFLREKIHYVKVQENYGRTYEDHATRSDDDSGGDGRISGDRGRVLIPPDAAARVPSSEAWEQLPDLPR